MEQSWPTLRITTPHCIRVIQKPTKIVKTLCPVSEPTRETRVSRIRITGATHVPSTREDFSTFIFVFVLLALLSTATVSRCPGGCRPSMWCRYRARGHDSRTLYTYNRSRQNTHSVDISSADSPSCSRRRSTASCALRPVPRSSAPRCNCSAGLYPMLASPPPLLHTGKSKRTLK